MARVATPSDEVMTLCRSLHKFNCPREVEVRPWAFAHESQCFVNVRERVNIEGGSIRYGWALWQPCGAFLAAEHHAVWEPPSRTSWIDITPPRLPVNRILFLPDERAVYQGKLVDNKRLPLVEDHRFREFDRLCGEQIDIENSLRAKVLTPNTREILDKRWLDVSGRSQSLRRELYAAYPLPSLAG